MSTTSSAPQKLTKKQQKALRHKSGVRKGKGKEVSGGEEAQLDVPEEDLLLDDGDDDDGDASPSKKDKKSKKRKREDNVADAANANDDEQGSERSAAKAAATSKKNKKKPASAAPPKERKQRFIVFVGNLPYKVTTEDIVNHFKECGETPSVRLLTPKTADPEKASKSKGCAFVEFQTGAALQAALHLHQSLFTSSGTSTKRKINVELTAGGGGNSEARRGKLQQTKERLEKQRENRKTVLDKEKEAKEEEKRKVREEWKKNVKNFGNPHTDDSHSQPHDGQPQQKKQRKMKKPAWLTGANAVKMG